MHCDHRDSNYHLYIHMIECITTECTNKTSDSGSRSGDGRNYAASDTLNFEPITQLDMIHACAKILLSK